VTYVERLDWDSSFFGFPIGKVRGDLPANELEFAVQEADERRYWCIFLLVGADDHGLLDSALECGFVVRDIRVELDRPVAGHPAAKVGLRTGRPEDLPRLRAIAHDRFRGTRFFTDKHFPAERSVALYEEWISKGVKNQPGWIAIVTDDVDGFVVCHADRPSGIGSIILIGVTQDMDNKGIGGALVAGAGEFFSHASLVTAKVVTQGHNIAAQRLYQTYGYRTSDISLWLHRWQS
jgi:dTDP-4-amino-4,6-dideoxy-D-galactose acyltransferase